ncbi:hypothetical protein NKH18_37285 [Streptomyces sp. M10(2022)]
MHTGDPVDFPTVPRVPGSDAGIPGKLEPEANRVGMVLSATSGTKTQQYVVLQGQVAPYRISWPSSC